MVSFFNHNRRHAMLLASAAGLFASVAQAAPAVHDLGALPGDTAIHATIWLAPHDAKAFEAAIAARMTRGSPTYHQWMSAAQAASYGATDADVTALEASLRQRGLTIVKRESDLSAIRVAGSAGTMQAAFQTPMHMFEKDGVRFYRNTSEPKFAGANAELIGGVTGLSSAHMAPFALRQMNLRTGQPAVALDAGSVNLHATFTDQCFTKTNTLIIRSSGVKATYVGPRYDATGTNGTKTCGYTASQIVAHYGVTDAYAAGYKGDGETIVLVDAYGSPTIQSDANLFSKKMGLPALTNTNFSIVYPDGQPTQNPYPTGWPTEISIDVEWAHALAPNAKIVLVVAPDDDETELTYALHYATANQLGDVISNSYGYPEYAYSSAGAKAFNSAIRLGAAQGIAVNVSTGDSGDNGLGTPTGAPSAPADSPFATGIGGTSLKLPADGGPVEGVWGINVTYLGSKTGGVQMPPFFEGFVQGSGGGESVYFEKPSWQSALAGTGRQLPDISALADPQTGAIIIAPNATGTKTIAVVYGGTSLSSPIFSGIWALANQAAGARLGQAAPIIAAMPAGAINDIVPVEATKSNLNGTIVQDTSTQTYSPAGLLNLTATQPNGFVGAAVIAGPNRFDLGFGADSSLMANFGWDNATGYGVPNGLAFIKAAASAR